MSLLYRYLVIEHGNRYVLDIRTFIYGNQEDNYDDKIKNLIIKVTSIILGCYIWEYQILQP